jgi:hypothetical protein
MFDAVCTFHEVEIATFSTTSRTVARQLAAQAALAYFNDPNNVDAFVGGCTCVTGVAAAKVAKAQSITTTSMVVDAPEPGPNEEGMQVDEEECSEERQSCPLSPPDSLLTLLYPQRTPPSAYVSTSVHTVPPASHQFFCKSTRLDVISFSRLSPSCPHLCPPCQRPRPPLFYPSGPSSSMRLRPRCP